ncbi:MAG: hypothetical protein LQ351_007171 [Letrouitia transgressa]|nr:MAG: hypothetical protein LQ351_007171 [Letrouitia transgressa]
MVAAKEAEIYRKSANKLSVEQREQLLKPYLPTKNPNSKRQTLPWVRTFVKTQLHLLVFILIQLAFSFYIRLRRAYHVVLDRTFAILYYHHHAPELIKQDFRGLKKIPHHLSVILELRGEEQDPGGLEGLLDEVAEISAWCACAGISLLSVYEKTGVLKDHMSTTHRTVSSKMHAYFGRRIPSLQIQAPHVPSFLNGDDLGQPPSASGHLSILLLSAEDGRSTLVDLTKTLAEMAQRNKLTPSDISIDLIDAELTESVMGEPDLLVLFSPNVDLHGYPPWQLRLTEIFHIQDNSGVGYLVFLKALHNYAKAEMKFGR